MALKHWRGNIFYNSHGIGAVRTDITAVAWEREVLKTLTSLFDAPPNKTSQAVLFAINRLSRRMVITPFPKTASPNADESPTDAVAGTPAGQTQLSCSTTQPIAGAALGTGTGSTATVRFTAQDHLGGTLPGDPPDEVLLHEMVHGLRDMRGQGRCTATPSSVILPKPYQSAYDNFEEFAAILVTNVYRSECKRPGLRKDHSGNQALRYPLTNAKDYYTAWQKQIDKMCKEMLNMCIHIADIRGIDWNPIQYSVKSILHLDMIEDLDKYEALLNQNGW